MTTSIPVDKIKNFVNSIESFSKTSMASSEANTKKKIIEPLLDLLDWEICSDDVMLEYPIRIGSTTKNMDYALTSSGKPVALVEAKAFGSELTGDDAAQAISYGRVEDINWAILTNGKDLMIFNTKNGKTEKECLISHVDLKNLEVYSDLLKMISKESILTGQIEQEARSLMLRKTALENLEKRKSELSEEIKKSLVAVIGKELEETADNIAYQMVENAVRLFKEEATKAPRSLSIRIPGKYPGKITAITPSDTGKKIIYSKDKIIDILKIIYGEDFSKLTQSSFKSQSSIVIAKYSKHHAKSKYWYGITAHEVLLLKEYPIKDFVFIFENNGAVIIPSSMILEQMQNENLNVSLTSDGKLLHYHIAIYDKNGIIKWSLKGGQFDVTSRYIRLKLLNR